MTDISDDVVKRALDVFKEDWALGSSLLPEAMRAAIAEAVKAEREACAKVAENFNHWSYGQVSATFEWCPGSPYDRGQRDAAKRLAAAIRARS